jgi:hypothetical protein
VVADGGGYVALQVFFGFVFGVLFQLVRHIAMDGLALAA